MDLTDPVVQLLAGFVANVASDGVGALAKRARLPRPESELVSDLSLQAELQDAGVSEDAMIEMAKFLRSPGAHAIAYSALCFQGRFNPQDHETDEFDDEVLAYLRLLTRIDTDDAGMCAEVLARTLLVAANAVLRSDRAVAARFRSLPVRQIRLRLPGALEESRSLPLPDPVATNEFVQKYTAAIRAATSYMLLQHVDDVEATSFAEIYVAPRVAPWPQAGTTEADEPATVFRNHLRTVVLGDPGAGKSSLLRYILHQASRNTVDSQSRVPLYVELRRYYSAALRKPQTLREFLEGEIARLYQIRPPTGALEFLLTQGRGAVLFDGLDEVLNSRSRQETVDAVQAFVSMYPACSITVTSRLSGYRECPLDQGDFTHFRILPFDDLSVEHYAGAWFSIHARTRADSSARTGHFLNESRELGSLRSNPLTLSLLCATYAGEGTIPRTRVELYEKCATLLFDRWDALRQISHPSVYKGSARAAVLATAAWIYADPSRQSGVRERELVLFLSHHFKKRTPRMEDARDEARELVGLWRGRAWIITDIGTSAENEPVYRFSHQTFLEYFTAVQLVRTGSPASLLKKLEPRILTGEWEVVSELALSVLAQYQERGVDRFVRLLVRDSGEPRQRVVLLQFGVKIAGTAELEASTLLALFRILVTRFATVNVLSNDRAGYYSDLGAARLITADGDFDAYVDGSYVISVERADGFAGESPDDYEYMLLRLLMHLENRPTVLRLCFEEIAAHFSRPGYLTPTQAMLVLLYLRAATDSINLKFTKRIPSPTLSAAQLETLVRTAKSDWLIAAALNSCGLLSDVRLARVLSWQGFLAPSPIVYVSAVNFTWTGLLHESSRVSFDYAVRCLGSRILQVCESADFIDHWKSAPVEEASALRRLIDARIGWREASSDQPMDEVVHQPVSFETIRRQAGLFALLAVLTETANLEEYRANVGRMAFRLDLNACETWIEDAMNRHHRSKPTEALRALRFPPVPNQLKPIVDAWIRHKMQFSEDV